MKDHLLFMAIMLFIVFSGCHAKNKGQVSTESSKSAQENAYQGEDGTNYPGCPSTDSPDGDGWGGKDADRCKVAGHKPLAPPINVAYVEVNSNDIENAGCYKKANGEQLFNIAVIFAANINADHNGRAYLHLNDQVSRLLNHELHKIRNLQAKGIRVLLDVMGNHQNAGWSCFAQEADAEAFAMELSQAVDRYGLDGIDIDDEYSKCIRTYPDSLVKVTTAMRKMMPNKIISKALWHDIEHFAPEYQGRRLHDNLDYGWEMSYNQSNCMSRVSPYMRLGIPKEKLGVGASTVIGNSMHAKAINACVLNNDLQAGFMVFNLRSDSVKYLSDIWGGVGAEGHCQRQTE